ncbi:MAG: ABC-three component system protein [Terriglobia bacterium]|jgi:uncharacterized protein YydD (DUF2326 family)
MILSIESSIATFKTVHLHEGLNVLLADRLPQSTEKQTRNSAGKTSLIEIIHFLHGSDCVAESMFRKKELIEHSFRARFSIGGEKFTVERSGSDPSKIFLLEGGEKSVELPRKTDKASGRDCVSNSNWRVFLGHVMFRLPPQLRGTVYDEPFAPTFRAMFSYFARRRNSGGLVHPERHAEKQQIGDWQINLSYLIGLDWQIPFEFQKLRARERSLEELRKAAKAGAFGEILATVAELRPQVTLAETRAQRLRDQLANFQVLDSYRDLSRRAARAKAEMQSIGREAIVLNETLEHLARSLDTEKAPERSDLQQLYAAVGVELPGVALRRFEEVNRFHESVIENRRKHLQQEIGGIRQQLSEGDRQLELLDNERSSTLKTLEGRGALEDFLQLQKSLADCDAQAASLRERFKAAEILEGEATQLDIDRANLKRRLQEDHQQRKFVLDDAILIIAEAISELYDDRQGRFVVEATNNGPEFRISIVGDRGGGISNVEIFCFDLALLKIVTKRLGGPGFLAHDSHLFDGVDERQIAGALLLGSQATEKRGLQYIVTMNSDIFDRLPLSDEIDRGKVVLPMRISDETETGGLFGFRFE